jgi:hypothetical protein
VHCGAVQYEQALPRLTLSAPRAVMPFELPGCALTGTVCTSITMRTHRS